MLRYLPLLLLQLLATVTRRVGQHFQRCQSVYVQFCLTMIILNTGRDVAVYYTYGIGIEYVCYVKVSPTFNQSLTHLHEQVYTL